MAGDMIWKAAGAEEATSGCDTGGGCREAKGPKVRVAGSDKRRRRLRLRLRLQLRLKVEGAVVEDGVSLRGVGRRSGMSGEVVAVGRATQRIADADAG